ncbi:MAG: hypothetical protein MUF43_05115 [Flavobacterium sp.]|jgi:hypothetical protein|nr:hypothetical protein [Flavobacterium sp.]
MKNLFIIIALFSVHIVYGQSPFTINNILESDLEIGISFPKATNDELKKLST